MSERLQTVLSGAGQRKLLMLGLVAADPYLDATLDYMRVLADQGADIIELIFPFSDPTYHGAVIQRAAARALSEEVSWEEIIDLGQRFRQTHQTPVLFSVYYNQVLARGIERFVETLIQARFDGALVTDLPFEESAALRRALSTRGLALPPAVAPTTTPERLRRISQGSDSFLLWSGHAGGAPTITPEAFQSAIQQLREISSRPVLASMKIANAQQAQAIAASCDGIVVSSSLVWLIEGRSSQIGESLGEFSRELRAALDALD